MPFYFTGDILSVFCLCSWVLEFSMLEAFVGLCRVVPKYSWYKYFCNCVLTKLIAIDFKVWSVIFGCTLDLAQNLTSSKHTPALHIFLHLLSLLQPSSPFNQQPLHTPLVPFTIATWPALLHQQQSWCFPPNFILPIAAPSTSKVSSTATSPLQPLPPRQTQQPATPPPHSTAQGNLQLHQRNNINTQHRETPCIDHKVYSITFGTHTLTCVWAQLSFISTQWHSCVWFKSKHFQLNFYYWIEFQTNIIWK